MLALYVRIITKFDKYLSDVMNCLPCISLECTTRTSDIDRRGQCARLHY
jgi:hypothetical protein